MVIELRVGRWSTQRHVPLYSGYCSYSEILNVSVFIVNLDFSKIWPTSLAITSALKVTLHPCFTPINYIFLDTAKSSKDVSLRVAPDAADIGLFDHRLYRHEYISSPPLQELRVMIVDDDGPLANVDASYLSFLVSPLDEYAETRLTLPLP